MVQTETCLKCITCPYGEEDYESRVRLGVYDDNVGCDKVGGKVHIFGCCEDAFEEQSEAKLQTKAKSTKRQRFIKHRRYLEKLIDMNVGYPQPVMLVDNDKNDVSSVSKKPYYKRLYRTKLSKWLKRQSNRKIRHNKNIVYNGQSCHKLFDFWWELI